MEKDDGVKGTGNSYTTLFRQYDPRIGRFLSIDPLAKEYSDWNPYNFVSGNPNVLIDSDGKEPDWFVNRKTGEVVFAKNEKVLTPSTFGEFEPKDWLSFAPDDAFDTEEDPISRKSSRIYYNAQAAERFLNSHKLIKVSTMLIEKTTISTFGTFGNEERVRTEESIEAVLESEIGYAKPNTIGTITPISKQTEGNRLEATFTTERFVEIRDFNTGKGHSDLENVGDKGADVLKLISDVLSLISIKKK